jgi:hypothetical protein
VAYVPAREESKRDLPIIVVSQDLPILCISSFERPSHNSVHLSLQGHDSFPVQPLDPFPSLPPFLSSVSAALRIGGENPSEALIPSRLDFPPRLTRWPILDTTRCIEVRADVGVKDGEGRILKGMFRGG